MDKDVSDKVDSYEIDGECCTISNCPVCGKEFVLWSFILSIYRDMPGTCDCGAKLYFSSSIKVYQVEE